VKPIDLFFAARPMLHLPIWSIYLTALHYHHELSSERFRPADLGLLLCLSLLAAGAYYINQVYDYHTDLMNKKLGFLQRQFLAQRDMVGAYLVVSLLGLAGAAFYSWFILIVFLQLFVLGYVYSASPLRLKDRPVWGLLANAYCIGFLVSVSIMPDITIHNAGLLGWDNPVYFFLAVAAVYLLTTLPDRDGDRAAGKRTLAVVLPIVVVKLLTLMCLLTAAYIAFRSERTLLVALALIAALPVVLTLIINSVTLVLFAAKLPILLLTLLVSYFFPLYPVFVVVVLIVCRMYYWKRFNLVYPKLA
ncbi:MAG: UbiA family prenyltransferase, partial [Candidatus Zixiibacteriota bacterium]